MEELPNKILLLNTIMHESLPAPWITTNIMLSVFSNLGVHIYRTLLFIATILNENSLGKGTPVLILDFEDLCIDDKNRYLF